MKRVIKFLLLFLVLVIVGLPVGAYFYWQSLDKKNFIEQTVKSKSGYQLVLNEQPEITLWPQPEVKLSGLKVEGFYGNKPLIQTGLVHVQARLKAFGLGGIEITDARIQNPVIYMHKDKKERANWISPRKSRRGGGGSPLSALTLFKKASVEDLKFNYIDEKTGVSHTFKASLNASTLKERLDVRLEGSFNDAPVHADAGLKVVSGRELELNLVATLNEMQAGFDGYIAEQRRGVKVAGRMNFDGANVPATLSDVLKLQTELPQLPARIVLQTDVEYKPGSVRMEEIDFSYGDSKLSGRFAVADMDDLPQVSLNLTSPQLDLNQMGICQQQQAASAQPSDRSTKTEGDDTPWSDELVDLGILRQFDLKGEVSLEAITCSKHTFKDFKAVLNNKDGQLKVKPARLSFHPQGKIELEGSLKASRSTAGRLDVKFDHVPLQSLMGEKVKAALKLPLNGRAKASFKGRTTREWARSVDGSVKLTSPGGTIAGLGALDIKKPLPFLTQKGVDVSKLNVDLEIKDGVVRTEDFSVQGDKMSLAGSGKVDIGQWKINYRLEPSLHQGMGIAVPVVIKGSINQPVVVPDATSTQGVATGVGAVLGGPVGAGIGAVLGTMIEGKQKKNEQQEQQEQKENDAPADNKPPKVNLFNLMKQDGFEKNLRQILGNP